MPMPETPDPNMKPSDSGKASTPAPEYFGSTPDPAGRSILLSWALAGVGLLGLLSTVVILLALFMYPSGRGSNLLLNLHLAGLLLLVPLLIAVYRALPGHPAERWQQARQATPGMLVLLLILVVSLVLLAELAYLLTQLLTGATPPWLHHLAIWSSILYAAGACMGYAAARLLEAGEPDQD